MTPVTATEPAGAAPFVSQLLARRQKLQLALDGRAPSGYLENLMEEVDAALSRLADGSFGICETCHDTIEAERLISDPLTRFCLDHLTGRERRALEDDLTLSGRIQSKLLPPDGLACAGWEVAYHYRPAGVVSGDYCDAIPGAGDLFFLVGDVSGKGVAASILTAHLHAMFRTLIAVGLPLGRMISQANRLFCESTMPNSYATLVCGRATAAGEVEMANAGHCPAVISSAGAVRYLNPGGLPLGLFCESEYDTETFQISAGGQLVIYTDGVSEARDAADAEYGTDRIPALLEASTTVDALIHDLDRFRGAAPQHDDLTLMLVRRHA